ncbi:MAG TPA: AAA family ATPase [Candidatus Angelobacter sp.]|nr:AAA family ATPase [Candidatus Angelobacter sp.]
MSLHTAHRPKTWDQILGQDGVIRSLKKAVEANRAHSFLFTGPSGVGKTTLARMTANYLCGAATDTRSNIEEFPASEKSGKDDVKQVIARTHFTSLGESPIKVIIIDEAHRLSGAAWDALLKPIEEPQEHVYWMLCTTEPAKVPKAIVTRCLRYELKPVAEDLLFGLLEEIAAKEGLTIHDDVLEAIAENSGGSPRQALVYLEACQYCESQQEALKIMRQAGQSKEIGDLCRFLMSGRGTWADAVKLIKSLENAEGESIRIGLVNYLGAVLMNTKDNAKASGVLGLLECFKNPYNSSEKLAPLLYSVGLALNLDH